MAKGADLKGEAALVLDGVWKRFRRSASADALRDLIPRLVRRIVVPDGGKVARHFWALSDVSFSIPRGQCCGIIGPNGAGKSTVLKLISRLMKADRGGLTVQGRLSSLIEVGAGFHPDLTGRENIQLNAAILGLSRRQVRTRFGEIVDFAELHDFLDMPLKHYSSGMQARLGFAVAAHVDPDILLVDEVLSVGDMSFQNRCLERIGKFRNDGATVLLVSHNLRSIAQTCDRVIVLNQGRVHADAAPEEAIRVYLQTALRASGPPSAEGSAGGAELFDIRLTDGTGASVGAISPGRALQLSFGCRFLTDVRHVTLGFFVTRVSDHLYVYGANLTELGVPQISARAGDVLRFTIRFHAHLARGLYQLGLHVKDLGTQGYLEHRANALLLDVREHRTYDGVADLGVNVEWVHEGKKAESADELPADHGLTGVA